MAIKQCPRCASQYVLSATRCPDCDVDLVEVLAGDVTAASPLGPTIGDAIDQRAPGATRPTPTGSTHSTSSTSSTGSELAPTLSAASLRSADEPDGDDGESDRGDDDDGDRAGEDAGEHVTYEMGEWSNEARVMLEQLLAGAAIARVWEGTDLVVRATDEQAVDDLVDQVRSTDEPMLDPDAEKVVYEVNDWTTEQLVTLTDGLIERGIGYQFDIEGDLVVLASDEEGVEALLDVIEFGPASPGDEDAQDDGSDDDAIADGSDPDDGLETAEILSELFVACDKLQRNARDADGVLGIVGSAEKLADRALPFGYEPAVWDSIRGAADGLRDDLAGDEATDDELEDKARALRDRLRDYV